MTAVLACAPRAALSHRSAATLWGLRSPGAGPVEVTASGSARGRRGIRAYRNRLPADEVTEREGITVTIVPRTLLDLAAVLSRHQLKRAINEAEVQQLYDRLSLPALIARYPNRRGVRNVDRVLADLRVGIRVTKSELEDRFLVLIEKVGLPPPETNVWLEVAGEMLEIDCLWRRQSLVVELDGYTFHRGAAAFERDRRRDRLLAVAGLRVVRVTWRQVHRDPARLAGDLQALLQGPATPRAAASN